MEDNRVLENTFEFRLKKYNEIFERETSGIEIPDNEMEIIKRATNIVSKIPAKYIFTEYVKELKWISFDLNLGSGILVDITVPLSNNDKMLSLFSCFYDKELEIIDENIDLEALAGDLINLYNEANK